MKILDMSKRILMFVILIIVSVTTLLAQAEVNKQINGIKRSGDYFYEESTMNDENEAQDIASRMLSVCVNKYLSENGIAREKEVTVDDLVNIQFLKMKRGAMICVFAYVAKSDFVPVPKQETEVVVEQIEKVGAQSQDSINVVNENKEVIQETNITTVKVEKTTNEQVSNNQNTQTEELQNQQTAEVQKEQVEIVQSVHVEGLEKTAELETSEEKVAIVENISKDDLKPFEKTAIEDLLKSTNLVEAVELLRRLESRRVVRRLGTYTDCRDASKSFWVICDTNEARTLLAILGTGAASRMNYKTKQMDSLINYSGKNAIWFEFVR